MLGQTLCSQLFQLNAGKIFLSTRVSPVTVTLLSGLWVWDSQPILSFWWLMRAFFGHPLITLFTFSCHKKPSHLNKVFHLILAGNSLATSSVSCVLSSWQLLPLHTGWHVGWCHRLRGILMGEHQNREKNTLLKVHTDTPINSQS